MRLLRMRDPVILLEGELVLSRFAYEAGANAPARAS